MSTPARAAAPTSQDVDVYSSLCKIGSQTTVVVSGELGVIARRILAGEGKLSASKLQDEFPGIRDERNRLLALQSFQDCMYRYVEKFHIAQSGTKSTSVAAVNPQVSTERRREIVYLANELESFKQKMEKAIASVPGTFYDKRDSTDKRPREDSRLVGLADFSRYKAFQSASGGLDFSNATNNDIVILCNTYASEIAEYGAFGRQYQPLGLPPYGSSGEVRRICVSAARGR
jgi:hypothetical protein